VPDQHSAGFEHALPFGDNALVVARQQKEPERREQVDDGVEACGPSRRQAPHVGARVPERRSGAARPRAVEEVARQIDAVHIEPGLGQQMRMSALTARHVEYARPGRQSQQVDQPRNFLPIATEIEDRLILEEVVGVELPLPPLGTRGSTGARRACFRFPDCQFPIA
jgi:hypothetical protein